MTFARVRALVVVGVLAVAAVVFVITAPKLNFYFIAFVFCYCLVFS